MLIFVKSFIKKSKFEGIFFEKQKPPETLRSVKYEEENFDFFVKIYDFLKRRARDIFKVDDNFDFYIHRILIKYVRLD